MAANSITLYLEHVRSFARPQRIPLRPLTLLVGENSTGKSTLLAMAACVFARDGFPMRPAFNEPPFALGTYETIATFKGGKYGRDESFTVGFSVGEEGAKNYRDVKATYGRERGVPGLVHFQGQSKHGSVLLKFSDQRMRGEILLTATGNEPEKRLQFEAESSLYGSVPQGHPLEILLVLMAGRQQRLTQSATALEVQRLLELGGSLGSPYQEVVPMAPIRTKPRRTYDELSEDYTPEGDHIPKLLARIFSEEPLSDTARRVQDALNRFGGESGLFKQVEVKKLGRGQDAPFQVQVGVGGPRVNLVDVGYGVSQALPVIVQSSIRKENTLLLIQQPEVHLHPRAQASLGSFFAELVALGRNTVLIETHSDFLVDRVRQEVAGGRLKPEQVQILFFAKQKLETTVHPIEIDRHGNITEVPEHYRQFFLEEELNLLKQEGV